MEEELAIKTLNKYYLEQIIKPYLESEKIIDLHTHTNFSDGELTPQELIKEAIERKVGTIAITDHDTLNGIKSIDKNDKLIQDSKIQIINGIELTAQPPKGTLHILGYDIDLNNKELNDIMTTLKNNSTNSNPIKSNINGYMKGYKDNTFRPNDTLTREQFITMAVKGLDVKKPDLIRHFEDVESRWSCEYIDTAGYTICDLADITFRPSDVALREDVAMSLVKINNLENSVIHKNFTVFLKNKIKKYINFINYLYKIFLFIYKL